MKTKEELRREAKKRWRERNPGHQKRYYQENKSRIDARNKAYAVAHKDKIQDWQRQYRKENNLELKQYFRNYYLQNKPQRQKYKKENAASYRAYQNKRRARELQAQPDWVDEKQILELYKACPMDQEVDHILPLQGKHVCGLHVPWNLQYLSPAENLSKRNSFDFTYENEGWRSRLKAVA